MTTSWPTIIGLLFGCCPPAISWFIVSIVVGITVYRMFGGRPSSHVREEVPKIIPALANFYASTSPMFIAFHSRIITSFSHMKPIAEFWGLGFAMLPVRTSIMQKANSSRAYLALKTATAFGVSFFEALGIHHRYISARASTFPSYIAVIFTSAFSFQNTEPIENAAC